MANSKDKHPLTLPPALRALLDKPSTPDPILKVLLNNARKNASSSEGPSSSDSILKALLDNVCLKALLDSALDNASSSEDPSSLDPILKPLLDSALKNACNSEGLSTPDPILKELLDSALKNASSSEGPSTPNPILKALLDSALKNTSSSEGPSSPNPILKALLDRALKNASSSENSSTPNPILKAILDRVLNNGSTSSPPASSPTNSNTSEEENEINIEDLLNPDLRGYQDLYLAALEGNWEAAEICLQGNREAMTALISPFKMTALHVAASEGHSEFVEKIVRMMPAEALQMRDISEATALHHVAVSGSLKTAKALIDKNPTLANILDKNGCTPLLIAVGLGSQHKDLVWYLSMVTNDEEPTLPFTGAHGGDLAIMLSIVGFTDILLYLVDRYPSLATSRARLGHTFLHIMALTPESFFSCSKFGFWESCIYKLIPCPKSYGPPLNVRTLLENPQGSQSHHPLHISCTTAQRAEQGLHWLRELLLRAIKQMTPRFLERLQNAKLQHHCAKELVKRFYEKVCLEDDFLFFKLIDEKMILCKAAEFGIVEIVRTCLRSRPELAYGNLGEKQNLVSIAIEHRQEKIFSLFCEKNQRNTQLCIQTTKAGTMLHLAAKLAPFPQVSSVSGAALQMQRELQWFKAVEKLIHPNLRNSTNDEGKSARELFTEEHKALAEAGEKWMKDTSNSCMIVSTLIATFVFAAAFTVPGGNDGDGIPIFLWTKSFLVFVIADALALFSSITSLLMFFSILTARYAEEDFLVQLPKKLIFGLAALFFSIATMMMAFGATLYIVLSRRLNWVTIPIILLASFPVTIFALLQFPLFFQMFRSTFRNNIFRPQSPWR